VLADPEYTRIEIQRAGQYRTALGIPLIRGDKILGALALMREKIEPFTDREISLVQTFADQAAIAIENVRLFNDTKEALEQQTASSEVLGVISRSPTDLKPVFEAILDSALRLCGGSLGLLNLWNGKSYRTVAQRGAEGEF